MGPPHVIYYLPLPYALPIILIILSGEMMDDQTHKGRQDPSPKRKEEIQFGYCRASGKQNTCRITDDGLRAERMHEDGVTYGAHPLKGTAEFEVEIDSYGGGWLWSLRFGVMRCKKGVPIKSGPRVLSASHLAANHCVWNSQRLWNNISIPKKVSGYRYGYVDLNDLRDGDRVGLRLSQASGVLEFFVNGESQGIAAENVYTRNSDIYAVVDHHGQCVATVITKAGEHHTQLSVQFPCTKSHTCQCFRGNTASSIIQLS